ncbi:MAG: hypothetical protein ACYTEL_08710 [Planctomycetota bacterium]|jgi:hypothetical protein
MGVTLDGQAVFDGEGLELEVGSCGRGSVERSAPGLDGVVSIDLGGRGRKIKQRGVLRARSRLELNARISAVSGYMDGDTHKLVTDGGEEYDDLRMDRFKVGQVRSSGGGLAVDYEIVYRQLAV